MTSGVYIRIKPVKGSCGNLGHHYSEYTKKVLSDKNKGKKLSEETKIKIGLASSIRWSDDEYKEKLKKVLIGKNTWSKGKKLSDDTKTKLSISHKGIIFTEKHKNRISRSRKEKFIMQGFLNSKSARDKMSKSLKGHIGCVPWNLGKPAWNKGIIMKDSMKAKMREHRAKQIFPVKDTTIEVKIQNFLRELNIEFFTHQYMKEIEHAYQCDIFIPSKNLVIECDGNYWHSYPTGTEKDKIRTSELIEKGFKVLRLWESEIRKMNLEDFKLKI